MKPFCEMLINILVVNVLFYHRRIKVDCVVGNHRREGGTCFTFLQFYCLHLKLDQTFSQPAPCFATNTCNIGRLLGYQVTQNLIFLPSMKTKQKQP